MDEKGGGNNRSGGTWIVRSFDRETKEMEGRKTELRDTSWIGGVV